MPQSEPDKGDLRSRYTASAEETRDQETSSVRLKGTVKLIAGLVLVIVGVFVMLTNEALCLVGIIPFYFGSAFCVTGITNLSSGMDLDEFPKAVEILLRILPLLISGLVFWFILDNF